MNQQGSYVGVPMWPKVHNNKAQVKMVGRVIRYNEIYIFRLQKVQGKKIRYAPVIRKDVQLKRYEKD